MRTLYEKPSKEQREQSYFAAFLSLENDIPAGSWRRHEAPDYLLECPDHIIGLEITSLMIPELAAIRSAQFKAFQLAHSMAVEQNLPIMEVRAKFRDEHSPVEVKDAATELVEIIRGKLPTLDDTKLHLLNDFTGKYYSTIMVNLGTRNGRKWLDAHRWHHAHMNWVRQNPIKELQESINDKNAKLADYLTKCDECWLLVGVGEWTAAEAVYFSEKGLEHTFECGFSRAYFLRNIEGALSRLGLTKTAGL